MYEGLVSQNMNGTPSKRDRLGCQCSQTVDLCRMWWMECWDYSSWDIPRIFCTHLQKQTVRKKNHFLALFNRINTTTFLIRTALIWVSKAIPSYPAVRAGSSNTLSFFRWLAPDCFRSAKQIFVVSFATQARACILIDCNIFCTLRRGRTDVGYNVPGAFLVSFCSLSYTICLV